MTNQEINRAIAKSLGWKFYGKPEQMIGRPRGYSFHDGPCMDIPNYCEDLNAMHEAEKMLTPEQEDRYVTILCLEVQPVPKLHHATAAQKAEAYLKALDLWVETPTENHGIPH